MSGLIRWFGVGSALPPLTMILTRGHDGCIDITRIRPPSPTPVLQPGIGAADMESQRGHKERMEFRFAGKSAGAIHLGYISVRIDGPSYQADWIIWKMMTGYDPNIVDHIDGNKSNNAWCNLRNGTNAENCRNKKSHSNSQTGLKGVHWRWENGRKSITARIYVNGKDNFLGTFKTEHDAHAAYCEAAKVHFGEFWNPG